MNTTVTLVGIGLAVLLVSALATLFYFEQRAADMSVDHPTVLASYRTAHDIAVRQTKGEASTKELRQAMIHYRTLFEELAGEPLAS